MQNNKISQPPKASVNLRHIPPIHPFRFVNSSTSSKGKWNNSSTRAVPKYVKKSNPNQGMNLMDSDETMLKNLTLENDVVVKDASSIPSSSMSEACNNTAPPTRTNSADEGMKKGSARSKLHEICAVNHWKHPIFECCKEEGPGHQRMFTFKVTIGTQQESRNTIECYGAPQRKKKEAADNAAEGALWYLKYIGCVSKKRKK